MYLELSRDDDNGNRKEKKQIKEIPDSNVNKNNVDETPTEEIANLTTTAVSNTNGARVVHQAPATAEVVDDDGDDLFDL